VALFETHAADLVLVLLDLTMPGIDGVETYRRMRAIRPDVPVILCSGYPEHSEDSPSSGSPASCRSRTPPPQCWT
jgi:CheY-like chemotaxis protein